MSVFKELSNVIILNAVALKNLTPDDIMSTTATIHNLKQTTKKEIRIVEDISPYVNGFVIKKNILSGNVLLEHLEYYLDKEDCSKELLTIQTYLDSKQAIDNLLDKKYDYEFATVPDNFNIEHLVFTKTNISRKCDYGRKYTCGLKTFEKIWQFCINHWLVNGPHTKSFALNGSNATVVVKNTCVEFGCQTIQRYEVEAVALHLSLSFAATM